MEAPERKHWTENILVKVIVIGGIIIALMIPSIMIMNLVQERASRKQQVTHEVSSKWGEMQTLAGPYISIPYLEELKKPDAASEWMERRMNYFPATLNIQGTLDPL